MKEKKASKDAVSMGTTFSTCLIFATILTLGLISAIGIGPTNAALARHYPQPRIGLSNVTPVELGQLSHKESHGAKVKRAAPPPAGTKNKLPSLAGSSPGVGDEFKSTKMDVELVKKLGDANLAKNHGLVVERKRRNHAEEQFHEHRAKADSIAAAAESSAAQADSMAAALEAEEAEEAGSHGHDNGGGYVSPYFEEDDSGQDVVPYNSLSDLIPIDESGNDIVYEDDSRERAHRDFPSSNIASVGAASLFPTNVGESHHEHDLVTNYIDNADDINEVPISNMLNEVDSSSSGLVNDLSHHPDVQAPISKLLAESKDLAHEIRLVFQVLAKREEYLVSQMENLKKALGNAIHVLQENNAVSKLIRKKRDDYFDNGNDPTTQYKACVYISPPDKQSQFTNDNNNNIATPQQLIQPPPIQQSSIFGSQDQYYPPQPQQTDSNVYGGLPNDIDLTSVYWLKLPANDQEGVLEKVHRVITDLRQSGRDMLLIPITKGFTSPEDLARGFLRAVRVAPADTASQEMKGKRKKLRLRFKKI